MKTIARFQLPEPAQAREHANERDRNPPRAAATPRSSALLAPGKHTLMEGELAPGQAAHGEMLRPLQPVLASVSTVHESYCRALQFTESNFLWPLRRP